MIRKSEAEHMIVEDEPRGIDIILAMAMEKYHEWHGK